MNRAVQISILVMLSLIWIAQIAFIPLLLGLIFLGMILGLFWIYSQRLANNNKQQKWIKIFKLFFVLICLASIYLSYQSFLGVEAGTSLLAVFLYAKALETKEKRDLIVLFNFALFVSASLFLYSQAIWMAIIVLCCLISCLVGLYRVQTTAFIQQNSGFKYFKKDIQHILKVIVFAVPFFILLFLFFPRLPPLWHIPIANSNGVTGISDRMSPGDIAELSQSSALAFRIVGEMQKLPPQKDLYWRAMVLDQYDGTTWTSNELNQQVINQYNFNNLIQSPTLLKYQYLAADPRQKWITALETSLPLSPRFQLHHDGSITPRRLVQRSQPIELQWLGAAQDFKNSYQKPSNQALKMEQEFNQLYIQESDIQAQKFAHNLFEKSGRNPEIYINEVLQWYKRNHFVYTLSPGRLGNNRVDDFLFKTRQGFCEHYASSFVMLMRYVGIPSRVVVGYQGGQLAPDGQSWEVRQLDAHAWTEVFLNGQWQRFDPTFMVAPQRIDQGMQAYSDNERQVFGEQNLSDWKYQQYSMLKTIRVWSDYASYQWQSKVVGYDAEKQSNWLKKIGLSSNYGSSIVIILGLLILAVLYFIIFKMRQNMKVSILEKLLAIFSKQLSKDDQQYDEETFQQWMLRLAKHHNHDPVFEKVNQFFQKIVYLDQNNTENLHQFKKLLKECSTVIEAHKKSLSRY